VPWDAAHRAAAFANFGGGGQNAAWVSEEHVSAQGAVLFDVPIMARHADGSRFKHVPSGKQHAAVWANAVAPGNRMIASRKTRAIPLLMLFFTAIVGSFIVDYTFPNSTRVRP